MSWSLDEVKTLWKWDTKRFPRLLAALREEILIRESESTVSHWPCSSCPVRLQCWTLGLILTLRWDTNLWWVTGLGVQGVCSTLSFPSPCILFYFIFSNPLFWVVITDLNREFYLYRLWFSLLATWLFNLSQDSYTCVPNTVILLLLGTLEAETQSPSLGIIKFLRMALDHVIPLL